MSSLFSAQWYVILDLCIRNVNNVQSKVKQNSPTLVKKLPHHLFQRLAKPMHDVLDVVVSGSGHKHGLGAQLSRNRFRKNFSVVHPNDFISLAVHYEDGSAKPIGSLLKLFVVGELVAGQAGPPHELGQGHSKRG